jgi:hypothetical protein
MASYSEQELISFPSGEALTEAQAGEVTREDQTRVIVIAGPLNSGKTTILTSLIEAFQEAPFAGFMFRGSRTLVGFERRCHLGREESGLEEANTTHTSIREGIMFLHLALGWKDDENFRHSSLLLSDISGELFRRVRDSNRAAEELSSLRRADCLCMIIDGERIIDRETRQIARNDTRSILRSIVEADMLSPSCSIEVAFTKWDVVVETMGTADWPTVQAFVEETKAVLVAAAQGRNLNFHEVAARPTRKAAVPFAHGLPTLLRSWMSGREAACEVLPAYSLKHPSREINRMTEAMLLQANEKSIEYVS